MKNIYFSDIETTGLLHHLIEQGDKAKLHNLCVRDCESGVRRIFHSDNADDKEKLSNFLDSEIILVMHNGICYDKNALEVLGFNIDKVYFVDTLALSWYLDLNRPKHGLEDYGEECGVPKPEVNDWVNLTQEDYDHRVKEDVKIQEYVYRKLKSRFEELYGEMTDYEFCTHRVVRYLNYKMEQLSEQQNTKLRIDIPKAKKNIEDWSLVIEEKTEELKSVMPKVPEYSKHQKPAKPYLKSSELSATGLKWKNITEKVGLPFDYDGVIKKVKGYNDPNPRSPQQIKEWLFSLGWKPKIFKFEKDDDGNERKIPQLYIPQSGGAICSSIEELAEEVPEVQALVGLGVVKHRRGCVQGFLDSIIIDDCIEAGANGFTNTLRLKHRKPFVNLPSSRVAYGEDVRGCIIAREGYTFVCSDLSSMENIWKFNYQLPYDRAYVMSQQSDDYDPHLDIALEGGLVTQAQVYFYKICKGGFPVEKYPMSDELQTLLLLDGDSKDSVLKLIGKARGKGKNTNYGCQYGAGASTVAREAGVELAVGKKLVKAYKKLNWSINAIAKDQVRKKTSHGTYQWNQYSKIWYHLKTEKDSFSTLVQGSGSYLLDMWLKQIDNVKKEMSLKDVVKLCAQAHDENLQEFKGIPNDVVSQVFQEGLDRANKMLKVEIPFGCDTQFGLKYSEIH